MHPEVRRLSDKKTPSLFLKICGKVFPGWSFHAKTIFTDDSSPQRFGPIIELRNAPEHVYLI
jgi:hypothetical protein